MARLSFLGLGAMGAPMANRLIEAGHELTVWNRTRAKADAFEGRATIAGSPAEAARGAEAAITSLSDPPALSEVLFAPDGALAGEQPPPTLIDMSTVGRDFVLELAGRLPAGVELIDAPVLGSVANAVDGTLQVFVGARPETFDRLKDVLAPIGTPLHVGPIGAGAALKLVANSTLAGLMSLVGEALALADALELDQGTVVAALLRSPIGPALERKLDKIEHDNYTPSFKLSLMLKDMRLVVEAARGAGVELRLLSDSERWFDGAQGRGLGGLDYSAVVAHIRRETRAAEPA